MKKTFVMIYLAGFVVLFVVCAMVWHWQMAGSYFVCQKKGIILDFLPPFVNAGVAGDMYLKRQSVVYTIWVIYVGVVTVVPGVSAWLLVRMHDQALRKSWM